MLLQGLLELVETLKERIEKHGDALRASEALTRYALINPLLQELGWDTTDPEFVIPEYKSGNGSADYALLDDGKPVMMVEAKKLGGSLHDSTLSQGIQYCLEKGTLYFSVTDGRRWEIYETHKPVPIDQKRIVSFDLKEQLPSEVCLNALALWRFGVESGHVAAGAVLISEELPSKTKDATLQIEGSDGHDWRPFSALDPKTIPTAFPTGIRFPDGSDVPIPQLYFVVLEIVKWLSANGKIDKPVPSRSQGKLIVSADRRHSAGSRMAHPIEVKGWFISKHGHRIHIMTRAKLIIEHAGIDLGEFQLRFD